MPYWDTKNPQTEHSVAIQATNIVLIYLYIFISVWTEGHGARYTVIPKDIVYECILYVYSNAYACLYEAIIAVVFSMLVQDQSTGSSLRCCEHQPRSTNEIVGIHWTQRKSAKKEYNRWLLFANHALQLSQTHGDVWVWCTAYQYIHWWFQIVFISHWVQSQKGALFKPDKNSLSSTWN